MYTIKFRNRYLDWCDDRWYGTKKEPMFKFTLAECNDMADMLKNHYVYNLEYISSDGEIIPKSAFNKPHDEDVDEIPSVRKPKEVRVGKNRISIILE